MAITIGSNIAALGAQRRLAGSTNSLSKTFERLSSGLRINRASDDAAGLSIASALNADARVLTQGIRNLNDGISLLSIASGGLQELSAITTRQSELAEQAANGLYSTKQRLALDAEARALTAEYNRIVATTDFNNISLLNRDSSVLMQFQAGYGQSGSLSIGLGLASGSGTTSSTADAASGTAETDTFDFSAADSGFTETIIVSVGDIASVSDGDYFMFESNDGVHAFDAYFWLNVSGSASDPTPFSPLGDGLGFEVNLVGLTTADQISNKIAQTIFGNYFGPIESTVTDLGGNATTSYFILQSSSFTAGSGHGTFGTKQSDSYLDIVPGEYITFSSPTADYYAWFNFGSNNNPNIAGRTGIQINYNPNGNASTLRNAVAAGIAGAVPEVAVSGAGTSLTITSNAVGAAGGPSSGASAISAIRPVAGTATAINIGADTISVPSHGYSTAQAITISTNGTFPGGLSSGTYYAIIVDSNTIKLATSVINANSGTAVNITSAGTGTMTLSTTITGVSAYITDIDLQSQISARNSMDTLKDRLKAISLAAGSIGSFESRFTAAINNMSTSIANYKDAESRIRDADVAIEAANLARLSILQQAGAAVLSQAKQEPALALKLLKSI